MDRTLPGLPLVTSLTDLAGLLSWGAGGEKNSDEEQIEDNNEAIDASIWDAEAKSGAGGGTLVGRARASEQ